MTATAETPEGRLYAAGFTRRLEWWVPPGSDGALSLDDAIARLDGGGIDSAAGVAIPDTGVRAFPDELVDRICPPRATEPPDPPAWLLAQAEVIAEATVAKLKPVIGAEVRAALKAETGERTRETAE
jgi:hypothetical protein